MSRLFLRVIVYFQLTQEAERRWLLVLIQLERMRIAALTPAAK